MSPETRPDFVERWILPFVRDSRLWPVLVVVIGHVVAFTAPMLLLGLRDRRPAALLGCGLLAMAANVVRRELAAHGRPGALSALVAATGALAAVAAWLADRYALF